MFWIKYRLQETRYQWLTTKEQRVLTDEMLLIPRAASHMPSPSYGSTFPGIRKTPGATSTKVKVAMLKECEMRFYK